MSRLGKLPIPIPPGVTATFEVGFVSAKGPKGELREPLPKEASVVQADGVLTVTVSKPDSSQGRALWGLSRQLVSNVIQGVSQGYQKQLEINGIGFKAQLEGGDLVMSLGFSHPVRFLVPKGTTITVEKNVITVAGISKQQVGQVAAEIRHLKPPEPYKGKGIRYVGEVIRRKAGKVVKAVGAK